jgi:hypothetical protein
MENAFLATGVYTGGGFLQAAFLGHGPEIPEVVIIQPFHGCQNASEKAKCKF